MPIDQRLTATRNTPNKSLRQNLPRRGVCLHHSAMTNFAELRRLAMGAKQVSATNIVKDNDNERLMTDAYRAWSLSSAWGDSSFRTVETCNESTAGWTISDESHWTLARNVAYWAERDGFWPHRDGAPEKWTVLGHREVYTIHSESYATACPGGMDLALVTRRAQQLLKEGDEMSDAKLNAVHKEVTQVLGRRSVKTALGKVTDTLLGRTMNAEAFALASLQQAEQNAEALQRIEAALKKPAVPITDAQAVTIGEIVASKVSIPTEGKITLS